MAIYKSFNFSWLNLVQFSKKAPKSSKLNKMHPKVATSKNTPLFLC